jgi:RHH-type transcriptional regulator, proline utilization regulon repressor / proline dehydrogenase / delta 1-pyrroline-5-carboxylate dehydrogenase
MNTLPPPEDGMQTRVVATPVFAAPFAPADDILAERLLAQARLSAAADARIDTMALDLIEAIRNEDRSLEGLFGNVEDLLHAWSLSSAEGVSLMMLAEALLRVPDEATASRLIEDKISHADWAHREFGSDSLLVSATSWGLALAARIVGPADTPRGILAGLTRRMGLPAVRAATRQAVRIVGGHFVFGETIAEALLAARGGKAQRHSYSFDMLGEGARTQSDAQRYFEAYAGAIDAIAKAAPDLAADSGQQASRPGISIKLSALHPRYEAISRDRVLRELVPAVVQLVVLAARHKLNVTVDAEEADRLELSLDVIAAVLADAALNSDELARWQGFGLAVQAYQKRAADVIDYVDALAHKHDRIINVRLVKGAYWDTEIKRAQERGLDDFPVFTRKAMTDLNFNRLRPQTASVASTVVSAICNP